MSDSSGSGSSGAGRFFLLSLARLAGAIFVLIAALIEAGTVPLPEVTGWILAGLGIYLFFALPARLARRWKTPT